MKNEHIQKLGLNIDLRCDNCALFGHSLGCRGLHNGTCENFEPRKEFLVRRLAFLQETTFTAEELDFICKSVLSVGTPEHSWCSKLAQKSSLEAEILRRQENAMPPALANVLRPAVAHYFWSDSLKTSILAKLDKILKS